jgi:hypothetical protein
MKGSDSSGRRTSSARPGRRSRAPMRDATPHDRNAATPCHAQAPTQDALQAHDQELDALDGLAEDAERQRQRLVDKEIYDELALSDFSGPSYELFAKQIVSYGLGVMRAWIATGYIFAMCAAEGLGLCDELEGCTEDDVTSLANATVTQAVVDFREKGLRGGGWQFEGGRSMRTYFITGCVYAFPNAYRAWQREQARWRRTVAATLEPRQIGELLDIAAVSQAAISAFYSRLPRRQRQMVFLKVRGYSHAEIAHLLQESSAKAVEGVLYRLRQEMQHELGGGPGVGEQEGST